MKIKWYWYIVVAAILLVVGHWAGRRRPIPPPIEPKVDTNKVDSLLNESIKHIDSLIVINDSLIRSGISKSNEIHVRYVKVKEIKPVDDPDTLLRSIIQLTN